MIWPEGRRPPLLPSDDRIAFCGNVKWYWRNEGIHLLGFYEPPTRRRAPASSSSTNSSRLMAYISFLLRCVLVFSSQPTDTTHLSVSQAGSGLCGGVLICKYAFIGRVFMVQLRFYFFSFCQQWRPSFPSARSLWPRK